MSKKKSVVFSSIFLRPLTKFGTTVYCSNCIKLESKARLLSLLKSYLSNGKQRVVINGFEAEWGGIEAGVPQTDRQIQADRLTA